MDDLIRRSSIRNMYACLNPEDKVRAGQVVIDIDAVPSAENKGEWIEDFADNGWKDISCSECGWKKNVDVHVTLGYNFCPNCGARMKGADR